MTERRRGMKFTGDRYQIVHAEESVPVSVAENLWLQTTDVQSDTLSQAGFYPVA